MGPFASPRPPTCYAQRSGNRVCFRSVRVREETKVAPQHENRTIANLKTSGHPGEDYSTALFGCSPRQIELAAGLGSHPTEYPYLRPYEKLLAARIERKYSSSLRLANGAPPSAIQTSYFSAGPWFSWRRGVGYQLEGNVGAGECLPERLQVGLFACFEIQRHYHRIFDAREAAVVAPTIVEINDVLECGELARVHVWGGQRDLAKALGAESAPLHRGRVGG